MSEVMKKLLIVCGLFSSLFFTACYYYGPCIDGSGPVVGEIRELSDFTGVSNTGSFDVYVTQADEFYVEVLAQENIIPIIETYVSGSMLRIETKDGACFRSSSSVEVHVSLPELGELKLTGSGKLIADVTETTDFECSNSGSGKVNIEEVYAESSSLTNSGSGSIKVLESDVIELSLINSGSGIIDGGTVTGSAEVKIRHSSSGRVLASIVDGSVLEAILSGSGKIELDGLVVKADYTLNASGRIDALELEAADVDATITGSGKIYVWATELLYATITGSGDVIYRGQPTISFQITGSGSLRQY